MRGVKVWRGWYTMRQNAHRARRRGNLPLEADVSVSVRVSAKRPNDASRFLATDEALEKTQAVSIGRPTGGGVSMQTIAVVMHRAKRATVSASCAAVHRAWFSVSNGHAGFYSEHPQLSTQFEAKP
jgi:gentisate 1,2-dioxygenase